MKMSFKNEDNIAYEDDLKNEDYLKNEKNQKRLRQPQNSDKDGEVNIRIDVDFGVWIHSPGLTMTASFDILD